MLFDIYSNLKLMKKMNIDLKFYVTSIWVDLEILLDWMWNQLQFNLILNYIQIKTKLGKI